MKKYLTLLLMLMTVSWASAATYDLWIAGIQVTDANKDNITGYGIDPKAWLGGKVSYNSSNNTLTLQNVVIKGYSDKAIVNHIQGLAIQVLGRYNELHSNNTEVVLSKGGLTIVGDGILMVGDAYDNHNTGIYIMPSTGDFTIDGGARVVVCSNSGCAVSTTNETTGRLIVKGDQTMLMATSYSNTHDIFGFKDLILNGVTINKPVGAYYNTSTRCLRNGNANVGNGITVTIGKSIAINAANFPDAELRRAVGEWDKDGNQVLDRDENYQPNDSRWLGLDGWKVTDLSGLQYLYDLREIDANLLEVEGITFHNNLIENIHLQNGKMTYLEVDECPWLQSLWCQGHDLSYLNLSNNKCLVDVSAGNNQLIQLTPPAAFYDSSVSFSIEHNKLSGSRMTNLINKLPQNTSGRTHRIDLTTSIGKEYYTDLEYYKEEGNTITEDNLQALRDKGWVPSFTFYHKGAWTRGEYSLPRGLEYDIFVDDAKVCDFNMNDIMGDGGGMSYNHATNTLSIMSDYTFDTNAIQSYIPNLTIKTVDVSTLDCQSDAIDLYANTTITGNHRLAVKSKVGVGIFVDEGKTLTIDNATLEMSAQMPCILGATTTGEQKLNIKDSEIEAHSSSSSVAISGFPAGITFEGCAITEPAGGYVKDGNIVDKDGNWAYDVKIQEVDETVFSFALGDGIKQVDTYGNEQFTAINVLWTADILDSTYDQTTKTTTFFNKASGKNLFTLEPYNAKGDMAYFLCEGVTAEDAISYDFSSDRSWLVSAVYDYLNSYDAEDAEAFLVKYNSINLSFDIPAVPATEQWVGKMRNGMKLEEDETTLAASFVLLVLGDLTYESADDGSSSYYNAATNKLLFTINSDGIVTLGSGVTSADAITHRIIQADRAMMAEGTESLRSITLTFGNMFEFVLQDGTTLRDSYSNNLYNAINVLLPGGELVEMYNESTKTTTYCKPSGKKLFTLEPYNEKGDKAYFLADNVEAADAISYDYSDDMESLGNVIWNYPYQDGYDMDGALDFIEAFSAINLSFDIPEVRPTENMVIKVKDGMNGITDFDLQQYAALMAMWKFFGAIQFVPEGENYVYKTNDGKVLCYMSQYTGNVTLAEGVTAADKVYHRILHKDREAIKGKVSTNMTGQSFNFGEILQDVRSITLTVDDGAATGIEDVTRSEERSAQSGNTYNLNGQRVGNSYRGIAVSNGRKVVIK